MNNEFFLFLEFFSRLLCLVGMTPLIATSHAAHGDIVNLLKIMAQILTAIKATKTAELLFTKLQRMVMAKSWTC